MFRKQYHEGQTVTVSINFDGKVMTEEGIKSYLRGTFGNLLWVNEIAFHDQHEIHRDAKTGQFVSEAETKQRPDTTVTESGR